jgi:hydrogenase nickel incorporation protein HypA/HybF
MHESALARDLLAAVLARAGSARVRVVHGWLADTEALSHDSLAFHFAAHARGTAAEGARLALELVHVEARCTSCGRIYLPEHHLILCPACGSGEGDLLGETGLGLRTLEVDAP